MSSRLALFLGLPILVAVAACGGDDDGAVSALFEVPGEAGPPSGFYALPYPNDILLDDVDGHIDLSDHPRPNDIIGQYVDIVQAHQRGFSVNAATFMRFDGLIDTASLPASAAESVTEGAAVYLVNVDPASAEYGQRTPAKYRFEHYAGEAIGENWLSVLPYPGFPLQEETRYALVATNRLRAIDASPVRVAADFATIAGAEVAAYPALARAQQVYAPLWSWLDEAGGDERADVVAAAVFTTQDATALLGAVREVIWDQVDAPVARSITLRDANDTYVFYEGVYDAPNFQSGDVPYMREGGEIVVDDDTGLPVIERMEELRFAVTIPAGEVPTDGWPIVLYAHGTGGDFSSFRSNGTAARFAAEGLAVIGIDQVLHGPRNPGTSPEIAFFNFQNPLAARYNTLQGALDNFQLVRLALGFDFADENGALRFDSERIYFFGHSQGGLTGPPFLAHEPLIDGAILSGAGGLLYLSMILKTEPLDITAIVGAFIRDWPLDEFNPILAILQGWVDLSDGVSYARYLAREPRPGITAKHIFQSEGFTDSYTPLANIEGLATAMGCSLVAPVIEPIEGLELRGLDTLTAPVAGNLAGTTAVLLQYAEEPGSDGHFVLFDIAAAQTQSARFLATLAATGTATVVVAD